jgi:DNA-binding GntR family transcriptional regulator
LATRELKGSEEALEHHQQIVWAICRGDAVASVELLGNHIRQIEGFIERLAENNSEYVE